MKLMLSCILSSTSYIILWTIMNVNVLDNIIKSDLLSESVLDGQYILLQYTHNITGLNLEYLRQLFIYFLIYFSSNLQTELYYYSLNTLISVVLDKIFIL